MYSHASASHVLSMEIGEDQRVQVNQYQYLAMAEHDVTVTRNRQYFPGNIVAHRLTAEAVRTERTFGLC